MGLFGNKGKKIKMKKAGDFVIINGALRSTKRPVCQYTGGRANHKFSFGFVNPI